MKRHLALALAAFMTTAATPAVAQVAPQGPLAISEFVNRGFMSRVGAFAEVCERRAPGTKGQWALATSAVSARINAITQELMAGGPFAALAHESIPAEGVPDLLKAVESSKQALVSALEEQEPGKNCPQYLANVQHYSDDFLRASVSESLASIQTFLIGLKKGYYK